MKIFIACSKYSYKYVKNIKLQLEILGHEVILPNFFDTPMIEEEIKKTQTREDHIVFCRKSFLEKNQLFFYKGILHEDELWTPQVLICAKSIFYSGEKLYFHYMRDGSIMNSSNLEKSGKSDLIVTTFLKDIYNNTERKNIQYLKDHMANTYLQAVWKIPVFFNLEIWKRWEPLKNSYYLKTRLKSFLYFVSPKLYLLIHKIQKNF